MSRLIVMAAVLLAAGGTPAAAQFEVGGGLAGGSGRQMGVVAQVGFEFHPVPRSPVGLRIDASFHDWRGGFLNSESNHRASAVTADLLYRLPTERVRPYVLAGIGGYALQGGGGKVALNIGGGLEVPIGRHALFGELRSHFASSAYQERLIPLIVGIRF